MKHQQKSKSSSQSIREEIIAEYLTGDYSYRELGAKHDIPHRNICDWVRESQGRTLKGKSVNALALFKSIPADDFHVIIFVIRF